MEAELAAAGNEISSFIHLAAIASIASCEAEPTRAFELNVNGARKWAEVAARAGCRRFIQVSTSHIFKPTSSPEWLSPERSGDAISAYGRSKLQAEQAVTAVGRNLGIEVVIARVFSLIAPDMPSGFLYSELLRRAKEQDFRPLRGYKNVRDFIDANNVAHQVWNLAMLPRLDRNVFHLCTGRARSVKDLAIEVMQQYGISEAALKPMFPDATASPNYLISNPSPIPQVAV